MLQINNPALTLTHNAAGNITSDGQFTLAYDLRGRLVSVTPGVEGGGAGTGNGTGTGTGSTQYTHDNAGQRIRKFATGSQIGATGTPDTVLFAYDQNGQLLGEYDSTGTAIREYAWLGNLPIAVFMPDPAQGANANTADPQVFYVHADHLNTPRVVIDKTGTPRWRWLAEPFGTTAPETSPAGAPMFAFNLRFPGQFFDAETGMFYNYQRDYVPGVGRYAQSDPIGLDGGINTYGYVGGNPLSRTDPLGLCPWCLIPVLPYVGEAAVIAGAWWASQSTLYTTPSRGDPGEWHTNPADGKPGNGQERLYGPKGLPEVDIDWHPDHGAGKPHGHNWENGRRGPPVPLSPWPRGRSTNSCPSE